MKIDILIMQLIARYIPKKKGIKTKKANEKSPIG
jgi:hypothetical protein